MFDCHIHTGMSPVTLTPTASRADRDLFADWLRGRADSLGIDRFCGIMQTMGDDIETCRDSNRTMAALVRENPDILHGWARVNPAWGEDAVDELRRAVEEDGLLGLKLTAEVLCDDPRVFPLAEAAIEMDVPVKIHTMQRVERREELPNESFSENVLALAREYPDLKILASHIGGGGDWEHRIKNIQHQENVWLDLSGSVCDAGMVEMAAVHLGTDRLVFGTDNSLYGCVGKLAGADLTPAEKAGIAYNMASLLRADDPYGYSDAELDDLITEAETRFRTDADAPDTGAVDVNGYVGHWPFRELDASAEALVEHMNAKGVDRVAVSSLESVLYRNVHAGNRALAEHVAAYEDRLLPVATIDPTYAAWEEDLAECVNDFEMRAVKLLPTYHDYDLDDPAAIELGRRCADFDVPVMLVATLEDQRQRHSRFELRGFENFRGKPKRWRDEQIDDVIAFLLACPQTDVIVADAWQAAPRIKAETLHERRTMCDENSAGGLFFVLGDLFLDYPGWLEKVTAEVGPDHLVTGTGMPLTVFESGNPLRYLPVNEAEREAIRRGNAVSLLE